MILTRAILRTLRDGGPGTSGELAAKWGLPVRVVSATLCNLHRRGRIVRTGDQIGRAYVYAAKPPHRRREWTTTEVQRLARKHAAGWPPVAIARALDRHPRAVRQRLYDLGLVQPRIQRRPVVERQRVMQFMAAGHSLSEAASRVGVPLATAHRWASK